MDVINNKIHLTQKDYSEIARLIIEDVEGHGDEGTDYQFKCSLYIYDDKAELDITLVVDVKRMPYSWGDYFTPPEGGEIESLEVRWVDYILGCADGGEDIDVVFDDGKLNSRLN